MKATRRRLEKLPHTSEGDAEFLIILGCIDSKDRAFARWLHDQSIKRPRIYEEIQRYLIINSYSKQG